MSNSENPAPQLYTNPGVYEVSYTAHSTLENTHVLTSVEVNNAEGWGSDEDVFGSPDPYFKLFNASGTVIFESSVYDDLSFPCSWNIDNIVLAEQNYTIEVWDQDPISNDDNLGSVMFNGNTTSTTITNGALVVSITVNVIEPLPFAQVVDTVFVYENPEVPTISYDESNNELALENDSLPVNYQWYFYQSPVFDAISTIYQSQFSGYYSVLATNEYGCSEFSNEELVVICDSEFSPVIELNADTLSTNQYTNFNYQWLLDNEPISGADANTHIATEEATYSLILSDEWGCEYKSNEVNYTIIDIDDAVLNDLRLYPNPTTGQLFVKMNTAHMPYNIQLLDVQGRLIMDQTHNQSTVMVDLSAYEKGVYYLKIIIENRLITKKIILN